jgi:type II secretory pathway pseudopilin PulG
VKKNNKGFTFIELVLYMGILSVFMVAVTTLIGSTVASNRKMTARKKIQTQASETYDAISDMLMAAKDVKIRGKAYIATTASGVTSYTEQTGDFIIPEEDYIKDSSGALKESGGVADVKVLGTTSLALGGGTNGGSCYDIADIKSFNDSTTPSTDSKTFIKADASGDLYLYIEYASGIVDSGADKGESIITYCTLKYSESDKKIYAFRSTDAACAGKFVDGSAEEGYVLCTNVKDFTLQVNPDDNSLAIVIDYEDARTAASYSVNGVVKIRNSYVLKKHEWN